MFTTVAWSENIDLATGLQNITACTDQHMKVVGDSIYINQFNKLLGGLACAGAAGLEARFVSPSLRRFQPHEILPLNLALFATTVGQHDVDNYKVKNLDIDEQLEAQLNATGGAAEEVSVVAWLADAEIKEVYGDITSVRFSVTLAQLKGAWAFSAITFIDDLAVGTYDVVGLDIVVAGGVVGRLVPVGAYNRPGVPCMQTKAGYDSRKTFRNGHMGTFCTFPHNNPPSFEVMSSAAVGSATYYGVMDLIKK